MSVALQSQAHYGPQTLSADGIGKEIYNKSMDDPRHFVIDGLDIDRCRVQLSNSPIILLCGGKVQEKKHPDDPEPPIRSLRHAITRISTEYEIFRPEEIDTWHHDGIYKNLMDFEADLASICTLVVIVLESAGSIAELGAFSQLQELSKKLIVIKSNEYHDDVSFINMGLLRYILRDNETSVKVYPWKTDEPAKIEQQVVDDVVNDISDALTHIKKSHVFKCNNNSHVMVLICAVIELFVALKESEIADYLRRVGVTDVGVAQLRSKLFLLEKFRLVRKVTYGDASFYVRENNAFHSLRLSHKGEQPIDPIRVPVECLEYYNANNDRHRLRVINSVTGAGVK